MSQPNSSLPFDLRRRRLFGLDFVDATSVDAVLDALLDAPPDAVGEDHLSLVLTPNVDHLVQLRSADAEIEDATARAAVLLPDGQPIIWASRLLGDPLEARLTGSDLFPELWRRMVADQAPLLVVAPSVTVAEGLHDEYPAATVVVAPIFAADDAGARAGIVRECLDAMGAHRARHVVMAIGQPKQLLVGLDLLAAWPDPTPPLVYCLGAAPEMYLGLERRAPGWMQRAGIEWLYRFARQPKRLFKRYFVDDVAFAGIVFREWRARR